MRRKLFLLAAMLLMSWQVFAESGTCGDNLTWDLTNGVLTISGIGSMTDFEQKGSPWWSIHESIQQIVINQGVTSVGNEAFASCTNLTSVTIPNSVTSIGSYAFYRCTGLTSVTIPNSVTSVGNEAFAYCTNLTSVTIPNSVTSIGDFAFRRCGNVTSLIIGSSVTIIGRGAFMGCYSLNSITIPESVTNIGDYAFTDCSGLTSIIVENGNTVYDSRNNCNAIIETATNKLLAGCKNTLIPGNTTTIGSYAFRGCSSLTSINIPNSVTSIGYAAFMNCTSLTSVTLPNSVTSIGAYAFSECISLTTIYIPSSIKSIAGYAFESCTSLTRVHISDIIAWCKIAFYTDTTTNSSNPLIYAHYLYLNDLEVTDVVIPNSITSVGNCVFDGCEGLKSVVIPNSVTSIGNKAFRGCKCLTSINIPNSVTSIGAYAFTSCYNITSINIPNNIKSIGDFTFASCKSLKSITIPHCVASIGKYAFCNCPGLTSITCETTTPPTCSASTFFDVDKSIPLYVPAENIDAYKAADQWKDFKNIQAIQAKKATVTDLQAQPTSNSVVIEWPADAEAATYSIEIKKSTETVCTLIFDENGQLLNIAFVAPSRNGNGRHQAREALQTANGWQYTITGLDADTEYTYTVIAKRADDSEAYNKTIPFRTQDTATTIDSQMENGKCQNGKLIRDGQLFIQRGDKTYTVTGQEVK